MFMTAKRPPPLFIADNRGLDFLNSIAIPVDIEVESLGEARLRPDMVSSAAVEFNRIVATAIGTLACRPCLHGGFTYVKACEGSSCTLLFVDRSRGHLRRWCSMNCANRAKHAPHTASAQPAEGVDW
jgi:predicted RNA-binding Zn ribbon-like protein